MFYILLADIILVLSGRTCLGPSISSMVVFRGAQQYLNSISE